MPIRFTCPSCQTAYTVDDKNAGKKAKCAKCGEPIDIPDASASTAAPPAVPDRPSSRDSAPVAEYPSRRSSRRDRDDDRDYDDRRERRSSRRGRRHEEDDYGDEPIIRRRPQSNPAQGLAIASLILGVSGDVITIASGGPAVCAMCCIAFAPFVWVISGIGGVAGAVGLVLGFASRNAGNRSGMSTGGIVTGGIAIALAIAGIVLTLAFPAAVLMAPQPQQGPIFQNPNINQPVWPQQPINPPQFNPPKFPNLGPEGPPSPAGTRSTQIVGGVFDKEFVDAGPQGSLLVGLEVGLDKFTVEDVMYSVRPIYRQNNKDDYGKQRGKRRDRVSKVVARPGYAVGAITVKAGLLVDGLSITFMRVKGDKLDPKDSYESEWVGGTGGGAPTKLGGDGSPVVGIVGRENENEATGLGLLLKK